MTCMTVREKPIANCVSDSSCWSGGKVVEVDALQDEVDVTNAARLGRVQENV